MAAFTSMKTIAKQVAIEKQIRYEGLRAIQHLVTAQVLSPSGRFLFAGNLYGEIFVQDTSELEQLMEPPTKLKMYHINTNVYSLIFYEDLLIVGTLSKIIAYKWDEQLEHLNTNDFKSLKLPISEPLEPIVDVNSLWLRPKTSELILGCGDNLIYEVDLQTFKIIRNYKGHTNYIHHVTGDQKGSVYSASEDGTVRCWHSNLRDEWGKIVPSDHAQLLRNDFGKFVGVVELTDNFVLAGGGPKPAIFHTSFQNVLHSYNFPAPVHVMEVIQDSVFIAGMANCAQSYSLNGDKKTNIAIDVTCIYTMVHQNAPVKFMSLGGYSSKLHILKDFNLLDFKIDLDKVPKPKTTTA